jgi:small subunit ribosomal protein S9
MATKKAEIESIATGRRKTAIARVRLSKGSGQIVVNDRKFEDYFPTTDLRLIVEAPFKAIEASASTTSSRSAKAAAPPARPAPCATAFSRALIQADENLRARLKKAGFLTRDPRMKERKKPGQPGARRRFQFSKR